MRRLRILLTIVSLTLAFVLYQNFGLIMNAEMQEKMNGAYYPKKYTYDPNKSVKHVEEFYTKNLAFVDSSDEPKYFDHKKFLKDKWKESPLYSRLKNWVEVSDSALEDSRAPASVTEEVLETDDEIKVKIDPLKTQAMVRYIGSFQADIAYIQDESNLKVKVSKDIDSNTQIQLQHDASDEKTWIQYQFNW
jgi:hypothetical protein